jgi:micrococcal nuclease
MPRNRPAQFICFFIAALVTVFSVLAQTLAGEHPGPRSSRSGQGTKNNCQLEPGGESTVLAITGPQTLRLADGRFVRLSEVLVPSFSGNGFDPSTLAADYLRKTALGQKIELQFGGAQRDRYGVYTGHVFVEGEHRVWLQEGLVAGGLAQAYPQQGNSTCAETLIGAEAKARVAKRGLWGLALFKVLPAQEPRAILNLLQTYQIVEGTVSSASESGGRTILYFDAGARQGFSAALEPAAKKALGQRGAESWKGMSLRIRGWIERKRGPYISVILPEQIEFISRDGAGPNSAGDVR